MEGGIRVPKIARVAKIFLNATGTWVSSNIIRQCWPTRRESMPVQNLEGIRQSVINKLDETATRVTSAIAWDKFAFPQMYEEYWREEALCYHPWKMLDIRTHMPGFRLMLQDNRGQYPYSGRALIFEGSMLVYDPQQDITQWVPIQGTSATLTMSELCTANDLNNMVPSPSSELELVKPPSPKIMKGIPGGAESKTNSSVMDSGDEWDKTEGVGVFSSCSTLMTKIGPTWAEVHAAAKEEVMVRNCASTWEEIVGAQLPGDAEDWDAEDSQFDVEPHFEEAIIGEDEDEEQVVIESVMEEELEQPIVGEQLTHE